MKSKDAQKEESAPLLPHSDEAEKGGLGGMLLSSFLYTGLKFITPMTTLGKLR